MYQKVIMVLNSAIINEYSVKLINPVILSVLHQIFFHKGIEVAVEHALGVGGLVARAHILDEFVGMEHIGAYLGAPLYLFLLPLELRLLLAALLELDVVKTALEDSEGILAVVLLAAGLGIFDLNARGDMPHAHAGFDFVDVLPAVASAAEGVPFDVGGIDLDVDGVVHERIDKDAAEGGLPLALGIERRNAHEPVHARFGLEIAVGVVALELDGSALDSGFVALLIFGNGHLVAVALAPAEVHTHQHRGPVVGLSAACA